MSRGPLTKFLSRFKALHSDESDGFFTDVARISKNFSKMRPSPFHDNAGSEQFPAFLCHSLLDIIAKQERFIHLLHSGGCGMTLLRFGSVIAILALAGGCAEISTYTDPKLAADSRTGILYYPPKPYLLVSRTGAKDKPTNVEVIYLPDLSRPRYAKMTGGFGSSKMGLTFSNGVLVSANQESDPKIAEAIAALAGIPGQLASAAKTREETRQLRAESSDYPAIAQNLRDIAADLGGIVQATDTDRALVQSQVTALRRIQTQLTNAATTLDAPGTNPGNADGVIKQLEETGKALAGIKPGSDDPGDRSKPVWSKIRSAEAALDKAIAELKPKPEAPPTLTLYEVQITGAGTKLVEVPMSMLGGVKAP